MPTVHVGDHAPDFTANSQAGQPVILSEFRGRQAVVLFFYPKDNSAVCTKEACSFRDAYEDFVQAGAVVIGVSSDSAESHRAFASNRRLPFVLLADADGFPAQGIRGYQGRWVSYLAALPTSSTRKVWFSTFSIRSSRRIGTSWRPWLSFDNWPKGESSPHLTSSVK